MGKTALNSLGARWFMTNTLTLKRADAPRLG